MYLFDLFASTFRNPNLQTEDSDDEVDEFMSLVDNNTKNVPPTSPLYEQPMSDDRSTPFSKRYNVIRRGRSTAARYSAYKLPSREQRRRNRKELFVNGPVDTSIAHAEPSTVHPTTDLALSSAHVDMAAPYGEEREHPTHIPYDAQSKSDIIIKIPSAVDRLGLQLLKSCFVSEQTEEDREDKDVVDYNTQNSGLTIKIPGPIDRLALRFLGSCNVEDQTEEGEDEDSSSLEGSIASESSSPDGDGIRDHHHSTSPVPKAMGPDRTSRRRFRCIAAPYNCAEGRPKRKELWVDTNIMVGSGTFLLGLPAPVLRPS